MIWIPLSRLRLQLAKDRVYQRVTGACLLGALGLALIGQLWPSTTFLVTTAAAVMAAGALGVYLVASDDTGAGASTGEIEDGLKKSAAREERPDQTAPRNASAGEDLSDNAIGEYLRWFDRPPRQAEFRTFTSADFSRITNAYIASARARSLRDHDVYAAMIFDTLSLHDAVVENLLRRPIAVEEGLSRDRSNHLSRLLEGLIKQMVELRYNEVKAYSTLGASQGGGRFMVNVGPLKIVVTEEGTTVEVANPKATAVNFVYSERPAEAVLGSPPPATPAPTMEPVSRTYH